MVIQGTIIKEYLLTEEWKKPKTRIFPALETEDGIFILGFFGYEGRKFHVGENIAFRVGRFDLIDWHPL